MLSNMQLLFAYGSLRTPELYPMAQFLQKHARKIGTGSIPGRLYDLRAYPAAIYDPSESRQIHGAIYEISDAETIFSRLDRYESYHPEAEHESLFIRIRVPVTFDGQSAECWMYQYNLPVEGFAVVDSGLWEPAALK
jgi:gamma-glutamylcyclotransferase (GGCT)/AIG2-like uncharacterized protein YtfP